MLFRAGLTLGSTLVAGFADEVLNIGKLTRLCASCVVGSLFCGAVRVLGMPLANTLIWAPRSLNGLACRLSILPKSLVVV